jgi:hypothetical protein
VKILGNALVAATAGLIIGFACVGVLVTSFILFTDLPNHIKWIP